MRLSEALRDALGVIDDELEDLRSVFDRYGVRELALMWLGLYELPKPGTAARREYLSARRRFERYRAGLGDGPRGGRQTRAPADLEEFLDSLRERIQRRRRPSEDRSIVITARVLVRSSRKRKGGHGNDERHRTIHGSLSGECVDEILEALDAGNDDDAEDLFEECFGDENGFGSTPEFLDVDELRAP